MTNKEHHWAKKKKIEKHQEEQYNFLKTTFYAFVAIFFVVVFYVLLFSPALKITSVKLEGLSDLESEKVKEKVEEYLGEKTFFVFPKNNILIFSEKGIEKKLKDGFKKIKTVSISKEFPVFLTIRISERDLLLLWCSRDECFMVDEEGRAYKKADLESRNLKENDLVQVFDLSGKEVLEGGYVLEKEYCDFVLGLKEKFFENSGIVISPKHETSSRIAREVIVTTSEGWKIYLDSETPFEKSLKIFNTFFESEIDYEKRANLEYIDLRAGSKIFYKLRGEDGKEDESEQESGDSEQTEENGDQESMSSDQETESDE